MQRIWLSVLLLNLWVATSVNLAHTQPAGCYPIDQSAAKCECSIDTKWSVDLDLDGDQVPDFRQVRWEADGYCLLRGGARLTQRDTAEALFAVNGVEMNMMVWPYQGGAIATVKLGQTIPPEPDPQPADGLYWAWVKPQDSALLSTLGLGYSERFTDHDPCPEINCMRGSFVGVLTWTNQVYFGFRIPKAGNWHLGWLRIELTPLSRPRMAAGRS